ncbi:MAG: sensor histidine kinase [Nitriliruptoraceae bacterium]
MTASSSMGPRSAAVVSSTLPLVLAVLLPVTIGAPRSLHILVLLLLGGTVLAAPAVVLTRRSAPTPPVEQAWRVLSGIVGVVLLVVYLLVAVEVPVAHGQLIFLAALVSNVYLTPPRWRLPLGMLVVAGAIVVVQATEGPGPGALMSYLALLVGLLLLLLLLRTELDRRAEHAAAAAAATQVQAELLAALKAGATTQRADAESLLERALHGLGLDVAAVLRRRHGTDVDLVYASHELARELPAHPIRFAGGSPSAWAATPSRLLVDVRPDQVLQALGAVTSPQDPPSSQRRLSAVLLVRFGSDDGHEAGIVAAGTWGPWLPALPGVVAARTLGTFGSLVCQLEDLEWQEATVRKLEEANRQSQDAVATVSHELRTPLTVLEGVLELLTSRWDGLTTATRRDLLVRLMSNAERLEGILSSLLCNSAAGGADLEVRPRPLPLREHCEITVRRLGELLEGLDVRVDIPDTLHVHADPDLLVHVLENLLLNAAKHTPDGTRVVVSAGLQPDGRVQVRIADSGPGIPQRDLAFVTEPFYRGGDHLRRDTSGIGLGLPLVERLLRLQGSDLELANEDGLVARFTLEMVAAAAEEPVLGTIEDVDLPAVRCGELLGEEA